MIDDEDRENEGDLIFAAELATPELIAFMVRYTSGYICVPLTEADADRLDLPPMYHTNQDRRGTAYTVTVDAREGVTTGISASDRAHTIRLLADPARRRRRLRPARATSCRCGRRTAACCAGPATPRRRSTSPFSPACGPAGVLCEVVSEKDPAGMARADELRVFADEHDLALISIADLIAYRRRFEKLVERVAVGPRAAALRRVHRGRVLVELRPARARRVRVRRHRRRRGRAGARALRVPDRRRVRLAALRLRPAAGRRAGGRGTRGTRRRPLRPRARGPRHRAAAQAAGLPAAGRRLGHARREPRARSARGRPRLRHGRADPRRPRHPLDAAAVQQPGQARRPRGLRAARSSDASRCPCTPTRRTCATSQTKRDRMGHDLDIGSDDGDVDEEAENE